MAEALIVVAVNAALALGQGLLRIHRSANGKPSKSAPQAAGADAKRELTDVLERIHSLQKETAKINFKDRALETLKEQLTNWIKEAQELLKKNSLSEGDVRKLQQHKIKAFDLVDSQVKLCSKIMKELNAHKQPPMVQQVNHNVINNIVQQINHNVVIINQYAPSPNIAGPSAGAIGRSNHIKGESAKPETQRIMGHDIKGKAASGLISKGHNYEGRRDNSKGERKPEKQQCMAHDKGKEKEKERKPITTGKDKEKKPSTTGKDKEKEKKPSTTGSKGGTHKS